MKGGILRKVVLLGWLKQQICSDDAPRVRRPMAASASLMLGTGVPGDLVMEKPSVGMVQQQKNKAKELAVHVTMAMSNVTAGKAM